MQSLDNLSQFFKALSEPVRLRIFNLLLQREALCVCDLVTVLSLGQSTVSRHLAYLKNAGIVSAYRDGTWMNYKLINNNLNAVEIIHLKSLFESYPEMQQDLNALIKYEKNPQNCKILPNPAD